MLIIIKKILGLCNHDWEFFDMINTFVQNTDGTRNKNPTYQDLIQKCSKCQKIRKQRIH